MKTRVTVQATELLYKYRVGGDPLNSPENTEEPSCSHRTEIARGGEKTKMGYNKIKNPSAS